uniref:Uncharacterized protein n=1 Tax=Chenopodium quinoa TaxID=63459 RepID=A0A803MBP9_CHEQI
MTKLPFLVAFKPPTGCSTVEEAFPEGFTDRICDSLTLLSKAIKSVMDENSEISGLVKKNHDILRQKLAQPGLMSGYFDKFVKDLQALVGNNV